MYELPPVELRQRVGSQHTDAEFLAIGRKCVADITRAVPDREYHDALDFGAGCGRMLRHLLPTFHPAYWCATDPDTEAMHWVAEHFATVATFAVAPGEPLPLEPRSLDLIIAVSVFSHLRDWQPTLADLRRVLRPGGVLAFSYLGARCYARKGLPYAELTEPLIEPMTYCAANPDYTNTHCPAGWAAKQVARHCNVLSDIPAGLAGFQDLLVAERPT